MCCAAGPSRRASEMMTPSESYASGASSGAERVGEGRHAVLPEELGGARQGRCLEHGSPLAGFARTGEADPRIAFPGVVVIDDAEGGIGGVPMVLGEAVLHRPDVVESAHGHGAAEMIRLERDPESAEGGGE